MDIYLDIDGVLLSNTEPKPANHASEFIAYILKNYPDSTYWLTTHCQGDAEKPVRNIAHHFDDETVELLKMIKPTTWLNSSAKTDAINFSRPFLWFDDNLFLIDKAALMKHNAIDNWIKVDLRKNPNSLAMFLESFPLPTATQ